MPEHLSNHDYSLPLNKPKETWLYRSQPSVAGKPMSTYTRSMSLSTFQQAIQPSGVHRLFCQFDPSPAAMALDFVDGLHGLASHGSPIVQVGVSVSAYNTGQSMTNRAIVNSDGDMLIIAISGHLSIKTEMGVAPVNPGELFFIPRGIAFSVNLNSHHACGFACENFGPPFLTSEEQPGFRDAVQFPTLQTSAAPGYGPHHRQPYEIIHKFAGKMWRTLQDDTPFNVETCHGNPTPFKYTPNPGSSALDRELGNELFQLSSPRDTSGHVPCRITLNSGAAHSVDSKNHRAGGGTFVAQIMGHGTYQGLSLAPGEAILMNNENVDTPSPNTAHLVKQGTEWSTAPSLAFMLESKWRFTTPRHI